LIAIIFFLLLGLSAPLGAQYTGPAMLTRGEVPLSMQPLQIDFRPYLMLSGIYDGGFTGISADPNAVGDVYGVEASFGVYGLHRWKHTSLGLDYRGSLTHYTQRSSSDSMDHTVSLGLTRQTSRHTALSLRESAGTYTRSFGMFSYGGMGTYDPTMGYLPNNEYYDNRTTFLSSHADLTYRKSARLSFNFGGDFFAVHYRSPALYGMNGTSARGDISYRISRHSSLGLGYSFSRYRFSRQIGGTDTHSLVGTYGLRLGKNVEFSLYGGIVRAESQFVRLVGLDPAIAALLGTPTQLALAYRLDNGVSAGGRLLRSFRHSSLSFGVSHGITPGNGIFLTSAVTSATAEYSFTGPRRWNVGLSAMYSRADANSDLTGNYSNFTGGVGATRQIFRGTHLSLRLDARQYDSNTYSRYTRVLYRATVGLAFSPRSIPLRLW
jgi:hypothetical protein